MQDKEEIEILSLRVRFLRIQLSEAEAHLAMKEKEAKAKPALKEKEAIAKAEWMATAVPLVLKEKETKAKVDRRADAFCRFGCWNMS
jgi:hypothetical protein